MPKTIITGIEKINIESFVCEICGKQYDQSYLAEICEKKHDFDKVPFKYKVGTFIQYDDWLDDYRETFGKVITKAYKKYYNARWQNVYELNKTFDIIGEDAIKKVILNPKEFKKRKKENKELIKKLKKIVDAEISSEFDDEANIKITIFRNYSKKKR